MLDIPTPQWYLKCRGRGDVTLDDFKYDCSSRINEAESLYSKIGWTEKAQNDAEETWTNNKEYYY